MSLFRLRPGGAPAWALVTIVTTTGGCHLLFGYDDFTDQAAGGAAGAGGGRATNTTTGGCAGCVDAQATCQPGDAIVACGLGGATCESCDDGNPCTTDACTTSGCTHTNADGVCPGGVCTNGTCMPLEEDCTNGMDDNGDTLVDCADPICTGVGYACVAAAPSGWSGPVGKATGTMIGNLQCGSAYPSLAGAGSTGLSFAPAECAACTCTTAGTCNPPDLDVYENDNTFACNLANCSQEIFVNATCTNIEPTPANPNGCLGSNNDYFVGQATTNGFNGTCTPSNDAPDVPPYSFTGAAGACEAPMFGQGCGGEVCAPPPSAPLSEKLCVFRAGDEPCPGAPYTQKTVSFTGATDTRGCTTCGCTSPPCTGTILVFQDASCTQPYIATKNVPSNGCLASPVGDADGSLSAMFDVDPAASMCTPTTTSPTGDVVGTGATTICCEP